MPHEISAMPTVSVIIPTYKHRDFVLQTLESGFAQTFTDYEVIVVNDGSPDDTAEVLRPLIEAGRIRYVEQANAGQAAARNRGVSEAQGRYIALLDDDDLWPTSKLEMQVAMLQDDATIGVVGGSVSFIDAQGAITGQGDITPHPITFESLFQGCPFRSPGQTLIRADILKSAGGFDERIWGADDYDLWLRLARKTTIKVIPEIVLLYRLHSANASKNTYRMLKNCLIVLHMHLPYALPCSRREVSRHAYQWLYGYIGQALVADIKCSIKSRQLRVVVPIVRLAAVFAVPALRDCTLFGRIVRDFIPARMKIKYNA